MKNATFILLLTAFFAKGQVLSVNQKKQALPRRTSLTEIYYKRNTAVIRAKDSLKNDQGTPESEREGKFADMIEKLPLTFITSMEYEALPESERPDFEKSPVEIRTDSLDMGSYRALARHYLKELKTRRAETREKEQERDSIRDLHALNAKNMEILQLNEESESIKSKIRVIRKNKRAAFFSQFYGDVNEKTDYLNNFAYNFGSATIRSELVSDYAGPTRLSFGSVVSTEDDGDDEDAEEGAGANRSDTDLKTLLNGGGNFYLNANLPIKAVTGPAFSGFLALDANMSADIDGIGEDVATNSVKGLISGSVYVSLTSDTKKFNFFGSLDYGWLTGSNHFLDAVGIPRSAFFTKPPLIGKAILGMTIGNRAKFYVTTKSFSNYPSLVSQRVLVGIQLLE